MKKKFLRDMENKVEGTSDNDNSDVVNKLNDNTSPIDSNSNAKSSVPVKETSTRRHQEDTDDDDNDETDLDSANSSVAWLGIQTQDPNKFPNFPTGLAATNRTPRDSSTLTRISSVSPTPTPNEFSTPQGFYRLLLLRSSFSFFVNRCDVFLKLRG
jgi:hypothetical protein